jgi:glycosyltransferase involved in cell wall biosynthesis
MHSTGGYGRRQPSADREPRGAQPVAIPTRRAGYLLRVAVEVHPRQTSESMIYIGIPTYNEAPTIGVLLWRIRKVFRDFPREYELLVYDDGSTDATAEVLQPYADVLPLTVVRGGSHAGYGAALDALCRTAAQRTRYARRDALVTMQADFTDQPEHIPDLVKRFEGGADVVVAEQAPTASPPVPVRRLRRIAPWLLRPFVRVPGVADPFGSFRLYRISVLREALKAAGGPDARLVARDGWAANVELLLRAAAVARRVETLPVSPRYDLRQRATRVRALADALTLYQFGRSARTLGAPRTP